MGMSYNTIDLPFIQTQVFYLSTIPPSVSCRTSSRARFCLKPLEAMHTTGDLLPIVSLQFVSPRHDKQTAAQADALHRFGEELPGTSLAMKLYQLLADV
jgi:hypothetical protein